MDRCSHPLANLTDSQRVPRGAIVCSLHDAEHARYPIRSQGGDAPSTTRIPTPTAACQPFRPRRKEVCNVISISRSHGISHVGVSRLHHEPFSRRSSQERRSKPMGLLMGTLSESLSERVVMAALPVYPALYEVRRIVRSQEGSLSWFLLKDVLLCTIMYLILSLCLNAMVSGIDASFVNRWLAPAPFAMDHLLRCRHTGGAPVHVPLVQDYAHPALVRRARGGSRGGRSLAVCASTAQRLA